MNIKYTGTSKGLTPFEWNNIPPFAILTGLNGAGKSQLLDLINNLSATDYSGNRRVVTPEFVVTDFDCKPTEVTYLRGEWQLGNTRPMNVSALQAFGAQVYAQMNQSSNKPAKIWDLQRTITEKTGKNPSTMTTEEFVALVPAEFFYDESSMPEQITKIFIDYHFGLIDATYFGTVDKFIKANGQPPWVIMDQIFRESNLPFTFNNPDEEKVGLNQFFQFKIFDSEKKDVPFADLSSGEKVLISLILFSYNSDSRGIFPRLLLMDEPDAHLHPSMANQFLRVIKNVLVEKHGVQVIMTTHSPSTIALAPDESIFIMEKPTRISKASSKNRAISLLTSGLVFVGQGTKTVIVEDESDVDFYTEFYNQLLLAGQLTRDIPVVFIPASSKIAEKSGGKTVVNDWAGKFFNAGFSSVIQGLIDLDSGNKASDGVRLLKRYSIENYWVDPIVIYAALLAVGRAPKIDGIALAFGEEYKLKLMGHSELQKIANKVHEDIKGTLKSSLSGYKNEDNDLYEEAFTSGVKLRYPKYLIVKRGKDLVNIYKNFFKLKSNELDSAFKRVQMIPQDVKELLEEIQRQ